MTEYFDTIRNERIVQYDGVHGRVAHESCALRAHRRIDDGFTAPAPPLGTFWMCMECKAYFNLTKREASAASIHFL